MKAAAYICGLLASLFGLVGVYHKALVLPEDSDIYFLIASGVCLIGFAVFQYRVRVRGEFENEPAARNWLQRTWADRSKRFWLALIIVAPVAIAGPFLAPYTGSALSFSQEIITSALSFLLFAAILWFVLRRGDRNAYPIRSSEPPTGERISIMKSSTLKPAAQHVFVGGR